MEAIHKLGTGQIGAQIGIRGFHHYREMATADQVGGYVMVQRTFGQQLKHCREMILKDGKRLTQKGFATELGKHHTVFNKWEGDKRTPSGTDLRRIVDLLLLYQVPAEEVELLRQLAQRRAVQEPRGPSFSHRVTSIVDMCLADRSLTEEQREQFAERIRQFVTRWQDFYRAENYLERGDRSAAEARLKLVVESEETDSLSSRPAAIELLAWLAQQDGRLAQATAYYQRLLLDYPSLEEKSLQARSNLGDTYRRRGRYELARAIYSEIPRGLGIEASKLWEATSFRKQASTYVYQGFFERAKESLEKSQKILETFEKEHDLEGTSQVAVIEATGSLYHQFEWLYAFLGKEESLDYNKRALETWDDLEQRYPGAYRYRQIRGMVYRGETLLMFRKYQEAEECFKRARLGGVGLGAEGFIIGSTSLGQGITYLESNQLDRALRLLRVALDTFEDMGDPFRLAMVYLWLGRLRTRTGEYQRAERLLRLAAGLLEGIESHYYWVACLLDLCDLHCWYGPLPNRNQWEESNSIAQKMINDYKFLDHEARLYKVLAEEQLSDPSLREEAQKNYSNAFICALEFHDCLVEEILSRIERGYEQARNTDRHATWAAYKEVLEFWSEHPARERFRLHIDKLERRIEAERESVRLEHDEVA